MFHFYFQALLPVIQMAHWGAHLVVGSSRQSLCRSHYCPQPGNWESSRTCWRCRPTHAIECGPACARGSPSLSPVHLQYQTTPWEREKRKKQEAVTQEGMEKEHKDFTQLEKDGSIKMINTSKLCWMMNVTCWSSGVQIPQVIWLSRLISEDQCLCPLTDPTRTKPSRYEMRAWVPSWDQVKSLT